MCDPAVMRQKEGRGGAEVIGDDVPTTEIISLRGISSAPLGGKVCRKKSIVQICLSK